MFEAVHGSAPDIAGKHLVNPTAFLWSACMMLEYLGENECAARIRRAVDIVLEKGEHLTRDLRGTAFTEEYVNAILDVYKRQPPRKVTPSTIPVLPAPG